jgi:hypothetical protein
MSEPAADHLRGRGLAGALAAAGHAPPVLVIADSGTVGRLALAWLESFDAVGWHYRVRSCCGSGSATEIESLAAEARSLGAKTIVALGDAAVAAAAMASGRVGVPCLGVQNNCLVAAPTGGV